MYVCMYDIVHMYLRMHVFIKYICLCVYVHVYLCIGMYMYVFMHISHYISNAMHVCKKVSKYLCSAF